MPIHDWTRVRAGVFHGFHVAWVAKLQEALNNGGLPHPYYAEAESYYGRDNADVLTLRTGEAPDGGCGATPTVAPRTRLTASAPFERRFPNRRVSVRTAEGDHRVAVIELVSRSNKSSLRHFDAFADKLYRAIQRGIHVVIVDLQPPTPRDPAGIHGAVWERLSMDPPFTLPDDSPLTLASYEAGEMINAYVEPTAVGRELFPMPLFLEPGRYIDLPLESTYTTAFRGIARRWRDVLEA